MHIKEKDPRSEEEKSKHMDRKTVSERATLLREIFEVVEVRPRKQCSVVFQTELNLNRQTKLVDTKKRLRTVMYQQLPQQRIKPR